MPQKEEQASGSVKSLWRYPVKSMAGDQRVGPVSSEQPDIRQVRHGDHITVQ